MDAERDAAAAMVEAAARAMQAAFSELSPRPSPIPPRAAVAQILQPALRALAAHQLRTPSDLPAQSVVAWLRTVASAMGDGVPPADAAQDGAGTALGGVEAVGKVVAPDGAAAGAGGAVALPCPRWQLSAGPSTVIVTTAEVRRMAADPDSLFQQAALDALKAARYE